MSEIVVELGAIEEANEIALVQALDNFARWWESATLQDDVAHDAPDLMVKTRCGPDGRLSKEVIFQDQSWATAFMQFWNAERNLGA